MRAWVTQERNHCSLISETFHYGSTITEPLIMTVLVRDFSFSLIFLQIFRWLMNNLIKILLSETCRLETGNMVIFKSFHCISSLLNVQTTRSVARRTSTHRRTWREFGLSQVINKSNPGFYILFFYIFTEWKLLSIRPSSYELWQTRETHRTGCAAVVVILELFEGGRLVQEEGGQGGQLLIILIILLHVCTVV